MSRVEPLFFICGALRSGTTLLRLMLDAHPKIANPGEMDFLVDFPADADASAATEAYHAYLRRSWIFNEHDLAIDPALGCEDLSRSFVAQLGREGEVLTINLHRHFDRAHGVYPHAKFVHLLRDPRDVARSSIGMGWASNVYFGVDHWIESERAIGRLRAQVSPDQILSVRYEDLLRDTERELERICGFIGVSYDPLMLSYPDTSTYDAPDPALAEQWRRKLGPREIGWVEGKAGDMMQALGYERSGHPAVVPGRLERIYMKNADRLWRWRDQARRHGAGITAMSILARFVPVGAFRDYVAARRNVSVVKQLK